MCAWVDTPSKPSQSMPRRPGSAAGLTKVGLPGVQCSSFFCLYQPHKNCLTPSCVSVIMYSCVCLFVHLL